MRILEINSVYNYGSTGRIAYDIQQYMVSHGNECRVLFGYGNKSDKLSMCMQSDMELKYNIARGRITGHHGYYNKRATISAIEWVKDYNPDIVHLHNIHGYYINVPILMKYIREYKKPVVWTFHDCWPFTGHCSYFDLYHCTKWVNGCGNCPGWGEYRIILPDRSDRNWIEKKDLFTKIENLIIVTPSQWLAGYVKQSFLAEYPVKVIHNGIDIDIFKPSDTSLKKDLNIEGKKLILGIAPDLNGSKGGKYLVELAKILGREYVIVILSLETKLKLPENVIALKRTNDIRELARIYSAADVFVNPTLQDNYPTVNLEAAACGTPVITFNTGGSPEGIIDGFGEVVEKGNLDALKSAVIKWANIDKHECFKNVNCSNLSKEVFSKRYLDLFHGIMKKVEKPDALCN